jgi:hypothetical protein
MISSIPAPTLKQAGKYETLGSFIKTIIPEPGGTHKRRLQGFSTMPIAAPQSTVVESES